MTVAGIIREHSHRYVPRPNWTLYAGDILVLQGDPTALQPVVDQAKLKLLGADEIAALKPRDKDDALETVEAVIAPDSLLIGNTPQDLHLRQNYEVNLLALSRAEERTTTRLAHSRFAPNDIVVLQGRQSPLNRALTELRAAAARRTQPGDRQAALALPAAAHPARRDDRHRDRARSRWRSASSSPRP